LVGLQAQQPFLQVTLLLLVEALVVLLMLEAVVLAVTELELKY
jgi:hypothetical protein